MNPDRSSHTQPLKPRWHGKNFSLRTLMIGVLLIGFSWTATVMWGPAAVQASSKIFNGKPGREIQVVAPFVITCSFHDLGGTVYQDETWIWFFGYTKLWSGRYAIID